MTDATRNYQARLHRDFVTNAQRYDPAHIASTLSLQGVGVSLLPSGVLHFADVETFLRLRVTKPELNRFTVRASFTP